MKGYFEEGSEKSLAEYLVDHSIAKQPRDGDNVTVIAIQVE